MRTPARRRISAKLESALAGLDFHRATLQAWRSEMVAGVNTVQYIKGASATTAWTFPVVGNDGLAEADRATSRTRAIPPGFFDANAAVLADREFKFIIKPLRDQGWRTAPSIGAGLGEGADRDERPNLDTSLLHHDRA